MQEMSRWINQWEWP